MNPVRPQEERDFTVFESKICVAGFLVIQAPLLKWIWYPKIYSVRGETIPEPPGIPGKWSEEDKSDHDHCAHPELCTCRVIPPAAPAGGDSRWDFSPGQSHFTYTLMISSSTLCTSLPLLKKERISCWPTLWRAYVINRHIITGVAEQVFGPPHSSLCSVTHCRYGWGLGLFGFFSVCIIFTQ